MQDTMHGLNLGVDGHVCGNLLWDEVVEKCPKVKDYDSYLGDVWGEFKGWCKDWQLWASWCV